MHGLKESKITSWWVAPVRSELRFINILSKDALETNLIVVGHMKGKRYTRELYTSTNQVAKITQEGVITAKGSFYPFEEAHPVYLKFLEQANKEETILAFLWGYINKCNKTEVIANFIGADGHKYENVTFDITPDKKSPILISGYSHELGCNVAFSPFNKRGFCLRIGIPGKVKEEIYTSSIFTVSKELDIRVQKVKEIFKRNNKGKDIRVTS